MPSCAGDPFLKTPNIDRVAREGVLFRNFFATTPLCSPSRASFLTGQYSHQHGVTHNGESRVGVFSAGRWQFNPNAGGPAELNALTHRLITYPRLLHDAGYETAWMGKLHMGNDDTPRPGFDHWVGFKGQGVFNDPELNIDGNRVRVRGYTTDILSRRRPNSSAAITPSLFRSACATRRYTIRPPRRTAQGAVRQRNDPALALPRKTLWKASPRRRCWSYRGRGARTHRSAPAPGPPTRRPATSCAAS